MLFVVHLLANNRWAINGGFTDGVARLVGLGNRTQLALPQENAGSRLTEADLRAMLEDAIGLEEQVHGTFIIETEHHGTPWEVILTPDDQKEVIIVVTAYPNA